MKFLALVWSNLKRKKLRTIADAALDLRRVSAVRLSLRDQGGVHRRRDSGGRGSAHRAAQGLAHPAAARRATRQRIANIPGVDRGRASTWFGGIYQDPKNFFAHLPGRAGAVSRRCIPEIHRCRRSRSRRGCKTRTGAIVGTTSPMATVQVEDRRPHPAHLADLGPAGGAGAWEFEIVGIYDGAKKGADTTGLFFPLRLLRRSAAARQRARRLVQRARERSATGRGNREAIDEEFANSPARNEGRAGGRVRRRASRSRSATSARS